jgi:hypothetical protein
VGGATVRSAVACAALLAGVAVDASPASGLAFGTAPHMPALPGVTLNGQSQTVTAQMSDFSVTAGVSDLLGGWNVTVNGDASAGHSAVFKVYCPGPSACGSDPAGYVSGGATLPANSLTLNSTGATWSGAGLPAPVYLCNLGCNVDSATPVKIADVPSLSLATTWMTGNWSATSVALAIPTTTRTPSQLGEVYNVDLVWTLNAGP